VGSELLKNLMKRAHECHLVLPEFQRDFVWKPPDTIKLLASVMNGYPMGGLLFMESRVDTYGARPLDGVKAITDKSDVLLILDGQQRLTSCYRALYGAFEVEKYPGRYYFNYGAYLQHPVIGGSEVENLLYFARKSEVQKKYNVTTKELAAGLFPLDIIFQSPRGTDYSKWLSDYTFMESQGDKIKYEKLSQLQSDFIRTFIKRVTSYSVHFEEIKKDTSSDVICTVFETINTTGKRLTVFDLLVARCFSNGIKLRDMLYTALDRSAISRIDHPDGEGLCVNALPRIVSLRINGSCRKSDLLELQPDEIKKEWDASIDALEIALTILFDEFGCIGLKYIPLIDLIPALS
jgi:hypothetical protein